MDSISVTLVVFFEDPFYVGLIERICEGQLTAGRRVFGAEPRDAEVFAFVLEEYDRMKFSPAVEAPYRERAVSPKRAKRDADRRLAGEGIGTRSQRALSAGREAMKAERTERRHKAREAQREQAFALRQKKRKEKKRGR